MAAPPHRVDHSVVDHKESRRIHATPAPAGRSRGAGGDGGVRRGKYGGAPSFLALAIQTNRPEDLGTTEGKLVELLQDEQGKLPARVKALRVRTMSSYKLVASTKEQGGAGWGGGVKRWQRTYSKLHGTFVTTHISLGRG